ncbi:MAG: helix-turn-helix domain-containing protein [Christensenellales bacterium]
MKGLARLDEQGKRSMCAACTAYLSSGLNLRCAAETMGIHRNTLAYRMRRIEARFALNLGDMNTCFELLFSSGSGMELAVKCSPSRRNHLTAARCARRFGALRNAQAGRKRRAAGVLSWPSRQSAWETWATKSAWN